MLLYFCDWSSYGSTRDLWRWMMRQIAEDPRNRVPVKAELFCGTSEHLHDHLRRALDFLASATGVHISQQPTT